MSEFKSGDWVRVTVEGKYRYGDEFKVTPPLPKTPGSLIWKPAAPHPYQTYKVLSEDGRWYGMQADLPGSRPDSYWLEGHVVLVDAGKTS